MSQDGQQVNYQYRIEQLQLAQQHNSENLSPLMCSPCTLATPTSCVLQPCVMSSSDKIMHCAAWLIRFKQIGENTHNFFSFNLYYFNDILKICSKFVLYLDGNMTSESNHHTRATKESIKKQHNRIMKWKVYIFRTSIKFCRWG